MSKQRSQKYKARVQDALNKPRLQDALHRFADAYVIARENAFAGKDFDSMRQAIGEMKDEVRDNQQKYIKQFTDNAESAGATVYFAKSAEDANNYIPANYEETITVSAIADFDGEPGGLSPQSYGFGRQKIEVADDAFASFSNYGSAVDLAAPGVTAGVVRVRCVGHR